MSTTNCDHYWLTRRGGTCPHCADVFPGQGQPSRHQLQLKEDRHIDCNAMTNAPPLKLPGTMEDKLKAALVAAVKAFEAGYPVKALGILKGALALLDQQPEPKHPDGFCPRSGDQAVCICTVPGPHPKPRDGQPCVVCRKHGCHDVEHQQLRRTYDDAMNH